MSLWQREQISYVGTLALVPKGEFRDAETSDVGL
jgi:hypothetical protein